MSAALGCVIAVQNRPAKILERTLQTYGFQTFQPVDKVLLDYGSEAGSSEAYRELGRRYGWRYVAVTPHAPGWNLSAAYNAAVAALNQGVEVVFKNDADMLLGQDVLALAAEHGRDRLCIFASCLATRQEASYPPALTDPQDLIRMVRSVPPPVGMDTEGIHAFPRGWFEAIGGFDLQFEGWGYEDSDLRERAKASIGIVEVGSAILLHQWHPRSQRPANTAKNKAYYDRMKGSRSVVRNRGTQGTRPVETALPGLAAMIPPAAGRILDLDCGAGDLGAAVKAQRAAEIVGIERDPGRAQAARARLDRVLEGDIEMMDLRGAEKLFDCVVCEHLLSCVHEPVRVLNRVRRWLAPGGHVVADIPNARYHETVASLLQGKWAHPCDGASDSDRIRYFTRREIEKTLYQAGLAVEVVQGVHDRAFEAWHPHTMAGEASAGPLRIAGLRPEQAEEFYVSHYLVRATVAPAVDYGLTSIVILTHNQLDYTRRCIDSILQCTAEPYELVFVDNASTDGTREYLATLTGSVVIRNRENLGFPAGVNQGLRAATGRQVLLLNNDTVVTTGWLGRLLRALHADPRIGLAGPCSNCVSGEQQVAVQYEDLLELDGFAWDWGKIHNRLTADTDRLVGFCFLIRREVIDAVGLLDERFGIGCFEDDDYCQRALKAGYRAVIARDAFVHHFGGRTFAGSGVDFGEVMRKNQQLFQEKWANESAPAKVLSPERRDPVSPPARNDKPSLQAKPPSKYKLAVSPGGGLRLVRENILISLCMIVRDNARTIEAAINSIKPWVDEMIVVDTGSKDETPQIVQRLGARLFHFPWCDDFSAARNESVRHAKGRWIFWMDSDDFIDADNGRQLRELAKRDPEPGILGYVVQVHCPGRTGDDASEFVAVDHVKLFRNLPELRFEGRIHEQILGAISRADGHVADTGLFVVHAGYDTTPEGQKRKLERDLRILNQEYSEDPKHPFTLFNLGMTYEDCGEYAKALHYLQGSCLYSSPQSSHVRKIYALMIKCHMGLGQPQAAWETCEKGLGLFPKDAELLFRKAMFLQTTGRLREAVVAYRHLLESSEDSHFKSVDLGLRGFKGRQNLAVVHEQLGEWEQAAEEWRRVVEERPAYRTGWNRLGDILLRRGKWTEAQALAEWLLSEKALRIEGWILRVKIAAAKGDVAGAWRDLETVEQEYAGNVEALHALCQVLFEAGNLPEAERALKELVRRCPQDASANYNLGIVYQRTERPAQAVEVYRQALLHRPDWPPTYINLGHSLKDCGMVKEAIEAFKEVLRLDPNSAEAKEVLECLTPAREK